MKTYILGKLLIDGTGNEPIENPVIVIEDKQIIEVGNIDSIKIPEDGNIIDRKDEYLLPGLIDSHSHAAQDSKRTETVLESHTKPTALRAIRGSVSLMTDLQAGVTTVRLLGDGADLVDKTLRDAIETGEIDGPRLLVCCLPVRPSHGTAPEIAVYHGADGVEGVRKRVREAIYYGADVIKMFISNISNGDGFLDYLEGDLTGVAAYTKEEIEVGIEEAHRAGLPVAAHCIGGPAIKWACEAGIDSLEHMNLMEESDIPYLLKSGTYVCDPNLHLFFDPIKGYESPHNKSWVWDELPTWWHEKVRRTREQTRTVMNKALRDGVKFALATDLNHGGLHLEAKYFVEEIGATPMEAIIACTRNGADCCKILDKTGTVEAGKFADIISLSNNPLENIESLKQVNMVMKEGKVYKDN